MISTTHSLYKANKALVSCGFYKHRPLVTPCVITCVSLYVEELALENFVSGEWWKVDPFKFMVGFQNYTHVRIVRTI
jgi:hypothetical protein